MNQEFISVISAFFGSLGFSIIYNIRGLRIWIPAIGGAIFCVSDIPSLYK